MCFLTALLVCISAAGNPAESSLAPMAHLERLLASKPAQIPPADADSLRGILTSTLSTGRGGELYAASADVRRAKINECISSIVDSFPQGPYQTELQREVKLSGFRSAISTALTAPLYKTAWTPQLESQAASLSESLGRVAEPPPLITV